MRRQLTLDDIEALAEGSAVLGTGGGGDPYLGAIFADRVLKEHGAPELISADELPDDAIVVGAAVAGSPVPFIEKLSLGHELTRAFEGMQEKLRRPITALMSPEIGGINTVITMALAAIHGLPIVDGDGMGRAFPEIQLVTYTLDGISVAPFVLADEHGNIVTIDAVDNSWTEKLARATVIQMGAIAPCVGFTLNKRQILESAVLGSVSSALRIGEAIVNSAARSIPALPAVVDAAKAELLFTGKVSQVERHVTGGWAVGEVHIEGTEQWSGRAMKVTFQNENLVAFEGDDIVACVPDLISIVEEDSGRAITTERLRYGSRVAVLAIACDEKWITAPGLELAGPVHFGYEFEYQPFAGRN